MHTLVKRRFFSSFIRINDCSRFFPSGLIYIAIQALNEKIIPFTNVIAVTSRTSLRINVRFGCIGNRRTRDNKGFFGLRH